MRIIPIEFIKDNEKLGCDIFDVNNRLLLARGVDITESNKTRLLEVGYNSVYVMDSYTTSKINPILPFSMQNNCIGIVKDAFKDFKALMDLKRQVMTTALSYKMKKAILLREKKMALILDMTEEVIDQLMINKNSKFEHINPKNLNNYSYQHAINTGILSVLIGFQLDRNYNEIKSLFLASILCEMGNLTIPNDILFKKDKLTYNEFEIIKEHCQDSYQEIKSCPELNYIIKLICLEHHEHVDGSGYPTGLMGDNINLLARIISVADTYDALTSDRSYRNAYPAIEAITMMNEKGGQHYDIQVLKVLEKVIQPFPVGTIVTINQKIDGIVMVTNKSDDLRPTVKVLGTGLNNQLINMTQHPDLKITGTKYNFD